MTYVWIEIIVSMLIALIIGFIMGWLIRGFLMGKRIDELQAELNNCRKNSSSDNRASGPTGFLSAPQGSADDLKKISGVGPVLENKLNEIGIYHFNQIATMDDAMEKIIDERLNFKGRIQREDWKGQANKLARGDETEFSQRYDDNDN